METGKGKTLIAIKVMDHFLQLYPHKKVMFVVHTVDLVNQQVLFLRSRRSRSTERAVVQVAGKLFVVHTVNIVNQQVLSLYIQKI